MNQIELIEKAQNTFIKSMGKKLSDCDQIEIQLEFQKKKQEILKLDRLRDKMIMKPLQEELFEMHIVLEEMNRKPKKGNHG